MSKMKKIIFLKKVKSVIRILFPFVFSLVISYFVVTNVEGFKNGTIAFIKDDFILNFLTIILSLSIAVIALLYSNVEKIRESLYKTLKANNVINVLENDIVNIFKELKHNTIFIFLSLVISWAIMIFREANRIEFELFNMSKREVCYIVEMALVFLSVYALYDIIVALFRLSEVSKEFSENIYKDNSK